MTPTKSIIDKILSRCYKEGNCLIYTGHKTDGYGRIDFNRKKYLTHRLIYTYFKGSIPDGFTIDHVRDRGCHSRACQNVEHMEAVPFGVNVLRGDSPTAINARKTHCSKGHLLNIKAKSGRRDCSICRFHRWRKVVERRKISSVKRPEHL